MNRSGKIRRLTRALVFSVLAVVVFSAVPAFAAEHAPEWRPTYDLVLKWINFIILVAIIVKYGRKPIAHFLKGQQEDIEKQILELETEKKRAIEQIAKSEQMLEDSQERLETIRSRIVAEGERKKVEIIETAKNESRQMIQDAKRKIDGQLASAQGKIRSELVDTAVSIALERLPGMVTAEDNEKILRNYMTFLQPT